MNKYQNIINSAIIKIWAKKNPSEAKELGARLIQNRGDAEKLSSLPSLGKFQDQAQEWAIKHPTKAKLLILSLLKDFAK